MKSAIWNRMLMSRIMKRHFLFLKANEGNPTLVFLYSVHTDHAGHKHKWMSPEYIKSIEEADVEIGKFLEKDETGRLV